MWPLEAQTRHSRFCVDSLYVCVCVFMKAIYTHTNTLTHKTHTYTVLLKQQTSISSPSLTSKDIKQLKHNGNKTTEKLTTMKLRIAMPLRYTI